MITKIQVALILTTGICLPLAHAQEVPTPTQARIERWTTEQLEELKTRIDVELARRAQTPSRTPSRTPATEADTSEKKTESGTLTDLYKKVTGKDSDKSTTETIAEAVLSTEQVQKGIKEALAKGIKSAISSLGREDGFFKTEDVKILLPEKFARVESTMRFLGQGGKLDDFVKTMNRAAESATPKAVDIFSGAISKMSIADAKEILNGKDDEATQYFKKSSSAELTEVFKPIVKKMTEEVGTAKAYKEMLGKLGPLESVVKDKAFDLDQYVTEKALYGVFVRIAEEEKKIRTNPASRTTELLEKVFGKKK